MGRTGSGKSHLARALALSSLAAVQRSTMPAQLVVIDPQGSDLTRLPGAVTFHDPWRPTNDLGQDWTTAPVARFVPLDPLDLDAYDQVYLWAWEARGPAGEIVARRLWCDEAGLVFPAHGTPSAARRALIMGRKRQVGHIANHTRPREIDRNLIAQADHLFVFDLPNPDDRRQVAETWGIEVGRMHALVRSLGEFEFLWASTGRDLVKGKLPA